jgi:uncharacterized protein YndB with AHSA1/START domain
MRNTNRYSMAIWMLLSVVLDALPVVPTGAAVTDARLNGFAVEERVHIAAAPGKVYEALVHPQNWWNAAHTFSGDSANLSLDAKAGGCFCEVLADGGTVQHATVVYAQPGKALRLRGPLGPFQGEGVDSATTFTLKATSGGTDLILNNNVGGYMKGGFGKWPRASDAMLTDLVAHLKYFAETGSAMSADRKPNK